MLAMDEAQRLGRSSIGAEHMLLGLVREGEGIAAGVLESLGVTLDNVRSSVILVIKSGGRAAEPSTAKSNVITCRIGGRDLDAIDALVEAGIRSTRSDAAAWLIHAGIESQQKLFETVYATVAEIRHLRTAAQALAQQLTAGTSTDDLPEVQQPPADDEGTMRSPDEIA